jgi:hypothetical protein
MVIGLGGGLFNVPLQAWLQERSPHDKLGAILAACQQLTAIGMLFVSGLFWLLRGPLGSECIADFSGEWSEYYPDCGCMWCGCCRRRRFVFLCGC